MSNPSLLDGLENQTNKANCACFGIAKGWTSRRLVFDGSDYLSIEAIYQRRLEGVA